MSGRSFTCHRHKSAQKPSQKHFSFDLHFSVLNTSFSFIFMFAAVFCVLIQYLLLPYEKKTVV